MSFTPTILTQINKQINRLELQAIIKDNSANKYVKKISSEMLLNLMIFAQLSEVKSMRHLCSNLNSIESSHYHLGLDTISLNGISHALANRPAEAFRQLFYRLRKDIARKRIKVNRRLKKFVSIVDSTSMPFGGSGSDWAQAGKSKRAAKAHVLYDANGMPLDMVVTGASVHDIKGFNGLKLGNTEVLIMDRAYYGFLFWLKLIGLGITFVTRAKKNMVFEVVKNRRGRHPKGVIKDQIVSIKNPKKTETMYLRLIEFTSEKGTIKILSNDLSSCAKYICDLYKSRWEIEVFFKWIKQNLKIKRFFARNQNAIEIQLWVAFVTYLLLLMIKRDFKYEKGMLELIRAISLKLLCHVGMADMLSPPKPVAYEDWKVGSLFDSSGQ